MAVKKELFKVGEVELTAHEKSVYDKVKELGSVDYSQIATECGISAKSAIATLARLEKTHGLLTKHEPVKVITYEVADSEAAE